MRKCDCCQRRATWSDGEVFYCDIHQPFPPLPELKIDRTKGVRVKKSDREFEDGHDDES